MGSQKKCPREVGRGWAVITIDWIEFQPKFKWREGDAERFHYEEVMAVAYLDQPARCLTLSLPAVPVPAGGYS